MSNRVAVYREVIIKSVKDAEKFLKGFSGMTYIPCERIDLCIEDFNGEKQVSWRWQNQRGNIFSPYLVVDDPAYCLYRHRKYVNAWQKGGVAGD